DSLPGNTVEVGGTDRCCSIKARVRGRRVIWNAYQNVRTSVLLLAYFLAMEEGPQVNTAHNPPPYRLGLVHGSHQSASIGLTLTSDWGIGHTSSVPTLKFLVVTNQRN